MANVDNLSAAAVATADDVDRNLNCHKMKIEEEDLSLPSRYFVKAVNILL